MLLHSRGAAFNERVINLTLIFLWCQDLCLVWFHPVELLKRTALQFDLICLFDFGSFLSGWMKCSGFYLEFPVNIWQIKCWFFFDQFFFWVAFAQYLIDFWQIFRSFLAGFDLIIDKVSTNNVSFRPIINDVLVGFHGRIQPRSGWRWAPARSVSVGVGGVSSWPVGCTQRRTNLTVVCRGFCTPLWPSVAK